mmetsp:Transcript_66031/g.144836  ORF Transcript_66031/g.144836 Transcript_66031/m.144836 type:complete len:423 (-) Transcript_66031:18-1286(-)
MVKGLTGACISCPEGWAFPVRFAALAALTALTAAGDSICKERFEAEFPQLRALSTSIPTHGHLPWMEVAQFHGDESEKRLEILFEDATSKVLLCWNFLSKEWKGGRFWYLEMAGIGRGTLCAPAVCSKEEMETEIQRSFLAKMRQDQTATATATELLHWSDLSLDFVVIGVDGCGSTALHRHLRRHSQVAFTNFSVFNVDEDFFLQEMGRQTLPFAPQVERLRDFRAKLRQQKVGLYQPWIWTATTLLKALAYNQHLKVVLSLCDPLDRFEKRLHGSLPRNGSINDTKLKEVFYSLLKDAYSGPGMVRMWQKWLEVFGNRLLVVEKTLLSKATTFQRLSDFLRIRGYPKQAKFHRYNSQGNRSSSLCQHVDLVRELKERFALEYKFLNSLDAIRTERIQKRLTHCERPSVLGSSCVKERCLS